jgi:hypothetical protein
VLGAAILLVTVSAFWFVRRRPHSAAIARPINVLQDDEDRNEEPEDYSLPQYYAVEPYPVPDPTTTGASEPASSYGRPRSMSTVTADVLRPQTPTTPTTRTRKSAALPPLPPVHIIQHDDAGPNEGLSGQVEPETIELPPAYPNIRQLQHSLFGRRG